MATKKTKTCAGIIRTDPDLDHPAHDAPVTDFNLNAKSDDGRARICRAGRSAYRKWRKEHNKRAAERGETAVVEAPPDDTPDDGNGDPTPDPAPEPTPITTARTARAAKAPTADADHAFMPKVKFPRLCATCGRSKTAHTVAVVTAIVTAPAPVAAD